jgi:Restriction endonuclease
MNLGEWRQCTNCYQVKHVDDFPGDNTKSSGKRAQCRLCHSTKQDERRKKNSGHWHAAIQENYRVRKLYGRLDEVVTPAQREELFALAENKCKQCGSSDDLETDHIIPLVEGGPHHIDNIQILCKACNTKKGDRYDRGLV